MQTRKPEKEAYQIVLNHFKVQPSETLFLDDNAENIAGAKKLGIRTILVTTQEQMYSDLRTLDLIS
jgi:HAD superfamily hydrolase (TIGR01509 family)